MPPESDSPLESLRKRLYTPEPIDSPAVPPIRTNVPEQTPPQQQGWAPPPSVPAKPLHGWKAMPWTSRFLVIAIGFFFVAGGVAAALFFLGGRDISAEKVSIDPEGPPTISSGDAVAIVIRVKNENPATIKNVNLHVNLPEGAREVLDTSRSFDQYNDTLGDLAPGQETSRTVNAVLFGSQNEKLTVPIRVEYKAEGSVASFVSEDEYTVTVVTSPISLTVLGPSEAASGEPFTVVVTARNNAPAVLEHVGVEVTYPPGFSLISTEPRPSSGTLFSVGTLAPGQQQKITIRGTLSGQDTDERVFRLTAGTRTSDDATEIALPYAGTDKLVRIARPFLATSLTLNGDAADTVLVPSGEQVSGDVTWQNNLSVPVTDARVTISFSGNGFDPAEVYAASGFYRSSDSTILFSKDTNKELAQLPSGGSGNGSFTFTPKSGAALAGVPNPIVTVVVSIAGNRVSEAGVPETISSTVTKTVKVGTEVAFGSRVLRSIGPFTNTGPIPPRPNTETTYTIELSAVNSVNPIAGAQSSMTLPSYVRFTGAVSPSGSVTYDERTRTVTWRANDLAGGATAKAYFQVALLPSVSQNGISPVLVSEQTFTATDRFTQGQVQAKGLRLTAQFPEDPTYTLGQGSVTQ